MIETAKKFVVSAISQQQDPRSTLIVSCTLLVIFYLTFKLRKKYSFFTERNIAGPRPWPLIGHLHKFILHDMGLESSKLTEKYGKIFGIYVGVEPRLMIADAETAMQICIRDFDAFSDHYGFELKTEYQENFLFFEKGDVWRRNRIFTSPTFTSEKIKQMYKLLDVCGQDLTRLIGEQINASDNLKSISSPSRIINGKDIFSIYTLDAIARCCYGLNLERAKGVNSLKEASALNEFVSMCNKLFDNHPIRIVPEVLFPTKLMKLIGYTVFPNSIFEPVAQAVQKMVQARKEASKDKSRKFNDYLQVLVDAKMDDKMELDDLDLAENHHANLTHESLQKDQADLIDKIVNSPSQERGKDLKNCQLSDMELISNAVFLLLVGLETTANVLSMCVYALSFHPEIQKKLYEEVAKIADHDQHKNMIFDYDKVTTCKYLDAVISETSRHMPTVPLVDRIANRDYHFEKHNFSIPKGTCVFIAIRAIHHNPEYWPEPHKFDPERFMPGNKEKIKAGSYCPFGQGPRYCVGMRFSLTETKLALARVIMQYQFDPLPGLTFPAARVRGSQPGGLRDPRVIVRERKNVETS